MTGRPFLCHAHPREYMTGLRAKGSYKVMLPTCLLDEIRR